MGEEGRKEEEEGKRAKVHVSMFNAFHCRLAVLIRGIANVSEPLLAIQLSPLF